jgi:hypothetical protein
MAKTRTRKAKKAAPAPRRPKAVTPAAGPVTLAEAKALARARHPKLVAAKAVTPQPQPQRLGAERKRLEEDRRRERERRTREYTATMKIMKDRGARRSTLEGPKSGAAVAKSGAFKPLQIFAEGDSWFDYPPFLFKGGVVPRLESRLGVPILNLATAGDEVRFMLGVEERQILTKHLRDGCPAGGPWDALLFSGGGNDIVANPMALWIRDWDPAVPPAEHIHQARFDAALALVRAGYEDLIAMRNALSPSTHLFFHGYDFAIPDGRGVCFVGPWLEPTFKLRRFPSLAPATKVVRAMLEQFAAMLTTLGTRPKVTFINGQGTLKPIPTSWHNELHPSRDGFDTFADLFQRKVKDVFPNRVA